MEKKPAKKISQEPNVDEQLEKEILNDDMLSNQKQNNILKYFFIIILLLLCGGLIALSLSTKISSILPKGMAPIAKFLSPSEALAIEKIAIYKLETDKRFNDLENIEQPDVDKKIKGLRNELNIDILNISKELSKIDNPNITNRLGDIEKKISIILKQVDDLIFSSTENAPTNVRPNDRKYDLIIKKLKSEIDTLTSTQELILQRFNNLQNENLVNLQNNNIEYSQYFDEIEEALSSGKPYNKSIEILSKKEVVIPKALAESSDGVVTLNYLKTNFPAVAHASLKSSIKQEAEPGLKGKLLGFLKSQVTVRSLEPQKGDTSNAILSRIQLALDKNDLSQAIQIASELNNAAKLEIENWLSSAVKRQAAVDAFYKISKN
ncbi:mitofilin family membrane protein [Amylibacter sp.]|nr:mitofilin family membrane protein [Amylibacter sp.]